MSLSSLLLFASVYFAAVATPGPGVAALVARVMAHGLRGVAPFVAGYVVGDLIWLLVASTGLAVLARNFAGLLIAIKVAGALYLLYIAWSLLRSCGPLAPNAEPPRATTGLRAFLGSLSLTVGNPKVIVFFLSILPLALDLDKLRLGDLAVVAAVADRVVQELARRQIHAFGGLVDNRRLGLHLLVDALRRFAPKARYAAWPSFLRGGCHRFEMSFEFFRKFLSGRRRREMRLPWSGLKMCPHCFTKSGV